MRFPSAKTIFAFDLILSTLAIGIIICLQLRKVRPPRNKPRITLEEYNTTAMTGDVITVCHGGSIGLRLALQSPWNHVGMVVVDPTSSEVMYYESSTITDSATNTMLVDVLTNKIKNGPALVRLADKMSMFRNCDVSVMRLENRDPKYDRNVSSHRDAENKDRYEKLASLMHTAKTWDFSFDEVGWAMLYLHFHGYTPIPIKVPTKTTITGEKGSAYCSELVAMCLQRIGALNDGTDTALVTPTILTSQNGNKVLKAGWKLDNPVMLLTVEK